MYRVQETFKELLKSNGYSVTAARVAVFGALVRGEALSMHELVSRARSVDRASVYRAVELFERLGVVQRLHTGWKYKIELSDTFSEHHHHLTCVRCGKTTPMNEAALEALIARLAHAHGFKPSAHQIEIQGVCQVCQSLAQRPGA